MEKTDLTHILKRLESLAQWFESHEAQDIEEGFKKIKESAVLIKAGRARLRVIANEFEEIQESLKEES